MYNRTAIYRDTLCIIQTETSPPNATMCLSTSSLYWIPHMVLLSLAQNASWQLLGDTFAFFSNYGLEAQVNECQWNSKCFSGQERWDVSLSLLQTYSGLELCWIMDMWLFCFRVPVWFYTGLTSVSDKKPFSLRGGLNSVVWVFRAHLFLFFCS